jgi:hypothetical protein
LAARGQGRDRRSLEAARSLSRVDACNPLLQAHPTWARDEHEGRGISTSLTPVSGHLTSPLRARPRVDPSGLGHAATFTRRLRDPPASKRRQRERAQNKSQANKECDTHGFVLPRFGSCKPTPHCGGHKDRVSFNPFPLSNGPSDRVSFSSQSIGNQTSRKDHHTIGVSCIDYN